MKIRMFLFLALAVAAMSMLVGDSYPIVKDMEALEFARVIGVDSREPGWLDLSASVTVSQQGGQSKTVMLRSNGATLNGAIEQMQRYTDKHVFFGYVAQYLLGQQTAQQDLRAYMDYAERDIYTMMYTDIYVVRDETAQAVIKSVTSDGDSLSDRLTALKEDAGLLSLPFTKTMLQTINSLERSGTAVLPALQLKDKQEGDASTTGNDNGEKGDSDDGKTLVMEQYAIISDYTLVDFIPKEDIMGANILMGNANIGSLDVGQGERVAALNLVQQQVSLQPRFGSNGLDGLTVKVDVAANIAELQGIDKMDESIPELEKLAETQLRQQMERVLQRSQNLEVDFLELGLGIEMKEPSKWKAVSAKWQDVFPQLPVKLEVSVDINRSYETRDGAEKGGRQ